MDPIETAFIEHHREIGFETYDSFPLVIEDPTVLFTNATITPFKSVFSGEQPFENFALVQKCLRLGGTGGTPETARTNLDYTSLFNMLGSGVFEVGHDEAVDYFINVLGAIGIERNKLIFSSIGGHALNAALEDSKLDTDQIRVFSDPNIMQHEWSFGEGDLHGRGIIAWYSGEGFDQGPELSDCIQLGRIVHIDGISQDGEVREFDYNAFDVGLGKGRVELAVIGDNTESMKSWINLSNYFTERFSNISDGDAHYMANLCCIIDELTAEGLMPGNKRHAYVLRKTIRSLIEITWIQSGELIMVDTVLGKFTDGAIDSERASEAIISEENAMRRILSNLANTKKKNPDMTPESLHSTYGVKPSLMDLL